MSGLAHTLHDFLKQYDTMLFALSRVLLSNGGPNEGADCGRLGKAWLNEVNSFSFLHHIQPGSLVHYLLKVLPGLPLEVKRPGCDTDHSSRFGDEVKNSRNLTSLPYRCSWCGV